MPANPVTRIGCYGLITNDDHMLLCRLSGVQFEGKWTLPGGGLEFGEHPEEAMVREVEEETGLIVRPVGLAGVDSFARTRPDAFQAIRVLYYAEVVGGTLRHEVDGTTDFCQWHRIDAIAQLNRVGLIDVAMPWVVKALEDRHGVAD